MQTSATGRPHSKCAAAHAGHTLVELLAVLAIVVLLAGMISLSAGLATDEGAVLEQEISSLLDLMEFAEEDAVLGGEAIGLFVTPPAADAGWRYHWRRYRNGWEDTAAPLEESVLPATFGLQLHVDGESVPFAANRRDETPVPVIVFDPAGATTPFRLTLSLAASERRETISNEQGRLQWLDREQAR